VKLKVRPAGRFDTASRLADCNAGDKVEGKSSRSVTETPVPSSLQKPSRKKILVPISAIVILVALCGSVFVFLKTGAMNVAGPLMAGNVLYLCDSLNGAKSPHSVKDYMVEEVRCRMRHHWGISEQEKWWFEHLLEPDVAKACKQAWSETYPSRGL
jgi:hypothetical protein